MIRGGRGYRLIIEGWIWEFVRRNREFRTIYESIRDLSSTVQVSRLSNNNMFRIEMPPVLANKLTDMEDKFGLRPNIEMKSSLVPSQFTIIDIENSKRVMGFPNPGLNYKEFTYRQEKVVPE